VPPYFLSKAAEKANSIPSQNTKNPAKIVPMETFSRETLDPWFVTGFVDGEGTFTYSRSGGQMGLYFAVKLTADDTPILKTLQKFFGGIGKIYRVVARVPRSNSGYTRTASYYRVTRHEELRKIVEHFDRYPLQSNKARSYRVWREMVFIKHAFRKPDRDRLNQLAEELSALSTRNQPWR
jgi:hypothetical protein